MAAEVKLKIGGDVSDLLSAVKSAMSQIQKEADKLKLTPAAAKAAPTKAVPAEYQSFQKELQTTRNQEQKSRTEQENLRRTKRELENVERQLSTNARLGATEAKNEKDKNFYATERNRLEKEYQTLILTKKRLEGTPSIPKGPQAGGLGGIGRGGITSLSGLAKLLGPEGTAAMAGIGTAIAGIKAAEATRRFFVESPLRTREIEASAFQTKGQGGQLLSSVMNGGANEELMFSAQRAQASQIAKSTIEGRYSPYNIPLPGPALALKYGQGIFGKDAMGAFEHGQLLQAGRAALGNFGFKSQQKEFEATKFQQQADIQNEQTEALKRGPEGAARTAAADKYLKDWRRNLDFQRQTGQSEDEFRGFLGKVNNAGFSDEQGMGSASGIIGAGGSTRAARGNAGFALQMGRQFDLTNAGQAIGAISGQMGSSEMSKEALIKIQAEGTRIGVNQSEFREENRKFVEMAANVINQSTATSGAGVDQLIGTFGKFMSDRTTTGMEAGRNAYEAYQKQSNVQTGPSAIMRAAGMMNNSTLNKLSGEDQASLFTLNQADVNVDDPGIQAMARKAGTSPKDLVNAYHEVQNASMFQRKSTDIAISKLSEAYKTQAIVPPGAMGPNMPGTENLEGEALNAMPLEPGFAGLNRKGQLSLARARATGDQSEVDRLVSEQGIREKAAGGPTGRPGDDMEKQQAEASRLANGLFSSFKDSIVPASTAVKEFATSIDQLLKAMTGTPEQRATALQRFGTTFPGMMPSTQPSTGPSANGGGTSAPMGR